MIDNFKSGRRLLKNVSETRSDYLLQCLDLKVGSDELLVSEKQNEVFAKKREQKNGKKWSIRPKNFCIEVNYFLPK